MCYVLLDSYVLSRLVLLLLKTVTERALSFPTGHRCALLVGADELRISHSGVASIVRLSMFLTILEAPFSRAFRLFRVAKSEHILLLLRQNRSCSTMKAPIVASVVTCQISSKDFAAAVERECTGSGNPLYLQDLQLFAPILLTGPLNAKLPWDKVHRQLEYIWRVSTIRPNWPGSSALLSDRMATRSHDQSPVGSSARD